MEAVAHATPLCVVDPLELRITIKPPCEREYEGTWAQLLAEGVVEASTQRPARGEERAWYSSRFAYYLRRKRLPGTGRNGCRAIVDWWALRIVDENHDFHDEDEHALHAQLRAVAARRARPSTFYEALAEARRNEALQNVLALGTPRASRIAAAALIARAAGFPR